MSCLMGFTTKTKYLLQFSIMLLISISGVAFSAPDARVNVIVEKGGNLGIIKGIVRDESGSPIAEASVAIFRSGTSKLLKQVLSARDGSFLARMIPGTYTVLAVAQGFNPVTLFGVELNRSAELVYGFKLERSGSGNTVPEKRLDRNSSKWRIRAAQPQRSIYQNRDGDSQVVTDTAEEIVEGDAGERGSTRKGQTVVESYFAGSNGGGHAGVNFATLLPVCDDASVVVSAQTATGPNAVNRLETSFNVTPIANHHLRFNSSIGRFGSVATEFDTKPLGQISFQALDEWKIREGIIFVFGVDYSRFIGASDDSSLLPRFGLQYDLNSRTRLRSAFTAQTEEKSWAQALDLEGQSVAFAEPLAVEDLVSVDGKPRMNKSRRLEFGIERIIDNRSSIEANIFFDTSLGRGVGLNSLAFDSLDGDGFGDFVADHHGKTSGIRVVYTRRINGILTSSAGYSFGSGQRISPLAVSDPSNIFETDFFQSFFAQLAADLKTGTSVKTVLRLSPQATVFAIDPFKGRLAIYDPGLSVYLTQSLPNLGLPFRAEAVVDARNIFDFQSNVLGDEGSLKLNAQRRTLRGGILVRF
ncbi:MAG: carboxypeptidase-like regulatory domain-containing protein [Pyrinomonadaceae bacterium]